MPFNEMIEQQTNFGHRSQFSSYIQGALVKTATRQTRLDGSPECSALFLKKKKVYIFVKVMAGAGGQEHFVLGGDSFSSGWGLCVKRKKGG